jgi:adenosylmethionine-8-amino-7-oxononanoate aminotransferase
MTSVPIGDNLPSSMFFWPTPERPMVDRGEGIYLWDQDGKRYIDGSSGPQTANIGHGNARVREAMVLQAEKVSYAFRSHFLNEPAELLAHEIADMTPDGLDQVFFGSGGSEVVEACVKLARQYALATGQATRYKVISRLPSYHGTTLGALSLTGDPGGFSMFSPMIVNQPKIPAPFCRYRPAGQTEDEAALGYANALAAEIIHQGAETILAFIMEPIGGAATAALTAPDVYYTRIREICDQYSVLLIFDEVMSGAGRSGKYLSAEHWGVTPDLVALAKGLASGYIPLGACVTSRKIISAVEDAGGFMHGHTYSASPIACAVGRAVLAEHVDNDLIGNAARMGALLKGRLEGLLDEFEFIGEIRGRGLLLGFDVIADRKTGRPLPPELDAHYHLAQEAYDRGLIIYSRRTMGGAKGDNFLVSPPLIVTEDQINEIMDILIQALRAFAPTARAAIKAN